jgi:hypothetical protein
MVEWRGEMRTWFWWGKPKIKSPLGRPRSRCEDNIKMDIQAKGLWHG